MNNKHSVLSSIASVSIETFLSDYWQKKYLLAKNAFLNFDSPISADELAGLALEEGVRSRLITEKSPNNFEAQHGPFPEDGFSTLPEKHWTLLVQNVDSLNPQINELLNAFRFIPNWRLDDIMVSYASDQGTVGPHFDYYDVFLIQAEGRRRWKLGQQCDSTSALIPNQDMKILADFQQQEEFMLEPGDMLYIPPGLAHWGISEGKGMTISIGFRAPAHSELLLELAHDISSKLNEDQRYSDKNLGAQTHPGEIKAEVIQQLQETITQLCSDKNELKNTFGKLMTQKTAELEYVEELATQNDTIVGLSQNTRSAWIKNEDHALLFINGEDGIKCSSDLAKLLTENRNVLPGELDEQDKQTINQLIELNALASKNTTLHE